MRQTIGICVLLALAVLIGFEVSRHAGSKQEQAQSTSGTESDANVLALKSEVMRLRGEVGRIRAEQTSVQQGPSSNLERKIPAESQEPEPSEQRLQDVLVEQDRARQVRYANLESRLNAEARDASWVQGAEATVHASVTAIKAQGFPGMEIEALKCASTLCQATFRYATREERDTAARQFRPSGFSRGTTHLYEENGRFKSQTYLARTGYSLNSAVIAEAVSE